MTTLVEFLRARYDEGEVRARAATPGPWRWEGDYPDGHCPHVSEWTDHGPDLVSDAAGQDAARWVLSASGYDASALHVSDADADHIAANNPAAILADVEAKRRIVDEHPPRVVSIADFEYYEPNVTICSTCSYPHGSSVGADEHTAYPCPTLRYLALPFAEHPDYDPSWRPAEVTA